MVAGFRSKWPPECWLADQHQSGPYLLAR